MWRGSHWPTSAGIAGWVTATPTPIKAVAARSVSTSGAMPRSAEPIAASARPSTTAVTTPTRATRREPANAAAANRTTGKPVRIPMSVPERSSSARSAGMTGGTARIDSRSAPPMSHSKISGIVRDWDFGTRLPGRRRRDYAALLKRARDPKAGESIIRGRNHGVTGDEPAAWF